jgi:hypothetical protein
MPKYFIDLDFEVKEDLDRNNLKCYYQETILNFFKPYIENKYSLTKEIALNTHYSQNEKMIVPYTQSKSSTETFIQPYNKERKN